MSTFSRIMRMGGWKVIFLTAASFVIVLGSTLAVQTLLSVFLPISVRLAPILVLSGSLFIVGAAFSVSASIQSADGLINGHLITIRSFISKGYPRVLRFALAFVTAAVMLALGRRAVLPLPVLAETFYLSDMCVGFVFGAFVWPLLAGVLKHRVSVQSVFMLGGTMAVLFTALASQSGLASSLALVLLPVALVVLTFWIEAEAWEAEQFESFLKGGAI